MNNKKAFVLMPFAAEFSDVYKFLIFDGLTKVGYDVKRADDIKSQNNILNDIIEGIVSSDLIIADLTGANPNVYYELGIAHTLNKKVILLTQDIDELPFDLRSYRVLPYDVHFTKMIQAKEELSQLALEAFKDNLPFGNPVKDYSSTTTRSSFASTIKLQESQENQEADFGLLDYQVKMEDGFEQLAELISDVGAKLANETTPEILKTAELISSGKYSAKQQVTNIQNLAIHLQEYTSFIKPRNEKYRALLNDIENSLEYILGGNIKIDENATQEFEGFIKTLSSVEDSAFQGRQGFVQLIDTMNSLPKIEKNFNRAKNIMTTELETFVANIDQTMSIISRAVRLGRSMLDRIGTPNT